MAAADLDPDEAAIAAAIAELGRPGPLRTDDLARGRVAFTAFARRRRRAAMLRTAAITTGAVAAAIVLVMLRFGPDLQTQLGMDDDDLAQSELVLGTEGQGGDTVPRELAAPRGDARGSLASPEPVPLEVAAVPVEEPVLVEDPELPVERIASPRKATPKSVVERSAGEMLAHARALTQARKLAPAVAAYEALIDDHPASAEARAALVSLGRVQLQRGRANPALRAFDRYLAGGSGSLGEEAHWGRIQALHALGRAKDRDAATIEFATSFPGSMYLPKARALASTPR